MAEGSLVFGLHAVRSSVAHPASVRELLLDRGRHDRNVEELEQLAAAAGIRVKRVDRAELDRRTAGENHQGAVALLHPLPVRNERDLEELLVATSVPFLLILDGVQDPHNLGACLRSANAAGVHAVIAPKDRACSLTPTVRKVASGAAEVTPYIQVTNLARTLRFIKEQGVMTVGLAGEAEVDLYQASLTGPLAVVMGAEGGGLRRLTRESCDLLVCIPMVGEVESLNVSVAAGVALFEARRQRG